MSDDQPLDEELDGEEFESEGLRSDDPIRRLIEGPPVDDAEYDTDLEEEFAPGEYSTISLLWPYKFVLCIRPQKCVLSKWICSSTIYWSSYDRIFR